MILIDDLSVSAGDFRLQGISMSIAAGEFAVLMGATGCGKTTLVESVCGLRRVDAGRIVLGDQNVTHRKPSQRGIGYVPQDGALFLNMTVQQQLAFPLEIRGNRGAQVSDRVTQVAKMLSIQHLLDRRPAGLSGGETQRVALGRALSFGPSVLILDEPLSALDDDTRRQMYQVLKDTQRQAGVTALHITHSRDEAAVLADRLFLLKDAAIIESPTSDDLLRKQPIAAKERTA